MTPRKVAGKALPPIYVVVHDSGTCFGHDAVCLDMAEAEVVKCSPRERIVKYIPAATAREEVWKAMVEALEQVVPDWLPESASEAAPVVKECYVDIAIRLVRARRALALARSVKDKEV